jgi:hypothetical protein
MSISASSEDRRERTQNMFPRFQLPDLTLDLMLWMCITVRLRPAGFAGHLRKAKAGGAERDRTDDLKLAKLALSQLSYSPVFSKMLNGVSHP